MKMKMKKKKKINIILIDINIYIGYDVIYQLTTRAIFFDASTLRSKFPLNTGLLDLVG